MQKPTTLNFFKKTLAFDVANLKTLFRNSVLSNDSTLFVDLELKLVDRIIAKS